MVSCPLVDIQICGVGTLGEFCAVIVAGVGLGEIIGFGENREIKIRRKQNIILCIFEADRAVTEVKIDAGTGSSNSKMNDKAPKSPSSA